MNTEIAQASAEWLASVAELEDEIAAARATVYALETKLRIHVAPAYLGSDAARKLLGGLLSGLDAAKAHLAISEARLAAANIADSEFKGV